jgi:hypothetical protein
MFKFTKDKRRGERRWRSYCTWMRRLQRDWDTHRGPWTPKYTWENGVCTFSPGDRTERCDCYNLQHPQALRFKDTPHPVCSPYYCDPRNASKGHEAKAIQERRAEEAPDAYHVRRRDPEKVVSVRQTCLCGFFFGVYKVSVKERRRSDRRRNGRLRCDDCQRRLMGKTEWWINGKLVEYETVKMPA